MVWKGLQPLLPNFENQDRATALFFNYYSFIRRENCERARVFFNCNVSAFLSRIRVLSNLFRARRSPRSPVSKGARTPETMFPTNLTLFGLIMGSVMLSWHKDWIKFALKQMLSPFD